jgi:hypothetical protein
MSNKMWESLVEHAKTCVLSGKHYIYYASDTRNVGAIFNNIYEFTGLIADDQFISAESLTDNQKVSAPLLSLRLCHPQGLKLKTITNLCYFIKFDILLM